MARIRGHRTLNVEQPLYVKRTNANIGTADAPVFVYKFGDVTFAKGSTFLWRQLNVTPRLLRILHEQRWIGHEKPDERTGAEGGHVKMPAPAAAPPPKKSQPQPRR